MALLSQCGNSKEPATATDTGMTVNNTETRMPGSHTRTAIATAQKEKFSTVWEKEDKEKIEGLLSKYAYSDKKTPELVIALARELKGVPYVAKTLENDSAENLVVNTRQLDCTTYVETVLALYECVRHGATTFADYCTYLRKLRYVGGNVSYTARQHYFSEWIDENTKDGFVKEIQSPNPPFTAEQRLKTNFMSTHTQFYPMLKDKPKMVGEIAEMEKRLSGNTYRFIPKASIADTKLFRSTIHDGDIIAITTSKSGLDTSHIGIAVWHKDGLHMLNASQIHKKVVEEPMTLYRYMQKHPSQTGIRIVRVM